MKTIIHGSRYLAQRGGSKRNTVHNVGPVPMGGGSPSSRHSKSPYQKVANGERRSSWASPNVTAQQQAHLDRMYRRSAHGEIIALENLRVNGFIPAAAASNSGVDIVALQREFQELGRLTLGIPNFQRYLIDCVICKQSSSFQ